MNKKQRAGEIERDIAFLRAKLEPLNHISRPAALAGDRLSAQIESVTDHRTRWIRPLAASAAGILVFASALLLMVRLPVLRQADNASASSIQEAAKADAGTQPQARGLTALSADMPASALYLSPQWEPDEADILEIHNGILYFVASANGIREKTALYLINAQDLSIQSHIELTAGYTGMLQVSDERVAILLEQNDVLSPRQDGAMPPCTTVRVYNVHQPAQPDLEYEFTQEGVYAGSRVRDGLLFLATRMYSDARTRNTGDELPRVYRDEVGEQPVTEIHAPDGSGNGYAVMTSLRIHGGESATRAIRGGAEQIYFSDSAFYTASLTQDGASTVLMRFNLDAELTPDGSGNLRGALGALDNSGRLAVLGDQGGVRAAVLDNRLEENAAAEGLVTGESGVRVQFAGDTAYLSGTPSVFVKEGKAFPFNGTLPDLLVPLDTGWFAGLAQDASGMLRLSLRQADALENEVIGVDIGAATNTAAFGDPQSFLYNPAERVIGFPIQDGDSSAFFLYRVNSGYDGITLIGNVSHSDGKYDYRTDDIRRGAIDNNILYTASDGRVIATALNTMETIAARELD